MFSAALTVVSAVLLFAIVCLQKVGGTPQKRDCRGMLQCNIAYMQCSMSFVKGWRTEPKQRRK
jgi:hypothetical protein